MDCMMYAPKVDEDFVVIQQRLIRLGSTGSYGYEPRQQASDELLGMGKYIVGHLLNAWENPPLNSATFTQYGFYLGLRQVLTTMIEREDLTLPQLQRYRQLITSEKA